MIKELKYIKREENDVEKAEFSSMEELKNLVKNKQGDYAFVVFALNCVPVFLNVSGNFLYKTFCNCGGLLNQQKVDEDLFEDLKSRKILMIKPD